jgi:CheY-like chemotaxis protein
MIQIEEAQNGAIAVEKFKEAFKKPCGCINRGYKLVLMDIQMPLMNGYQATAKIIEALKVEQNRHNRTDNIDYLNYHSILALTSFTGKDVNKKCMDLGMKEVIQKPISAEVLYEILNKYFYNE